MYAIQLFEICKVECMYTVYNSVECIPLSLDTRNRMYAIMCLKPRQYKVWNQNSSFECLSLVAPHLNSKD